MSSCSLCFPFPVIFGQFAPVIVTVSVLRIAFRHNANYCVSICASSLKQRTSSHLQSPTPAALHSCWRVTMGGKGKGKSKGQGRGYAKPRGLQAAAPWIRETRQRLTNYREDFGDFQGRERWDHAQAAAALQQTTPTESFRRIHDDLLSTWAVFEPQRHIKMICGRPVMVLCLASCSAFAAMS